MTQTLPFFCLSSCLYPGQRLLGTKMAVSFECSLTLTFLIDKHIYASSVHSGVFHFIGSENAVIMTWNIKFPYFISLGLTEIIYYFN